MKRRLQFVVLALLTVFILTNRSEAAPKNAIIMIADGMGFAHTEAASLYRYGYTQGQIYWRFTPLAAKTCSLSTTHGYDAALAYKDFDYFKKDPTDSAAAATALSCGVKTKNGMLGMTPDKKPARHLMEDAEDLGKATGVLSTVYFPHATPAGHIAHVNSRSKYKEIANQMLWESKADVIIGPGHPWYDDDGKQVGGLNPDPFDTPLSYDRVGGLDSWKKILNGEPGADADGDGTPDAWTFVDSRQDIRKVAGLTNNIPKRLLGVVPVYSTLQQSRSGNQYLPPYGEAQLTASPTMSELMAAALNVLSQDEDGFVLMAEGGAIDWASHANQSGRMIEEQIDFDRAVEYAIQWIESKSNWEDTILIVTADHECGYLTGPGSDPTWRPLIPHSPGFIPGMEWHKDSHTNQLVPLFVKGSGSEAYVQKVCGEDPVHGSYIDNTDIPNTIRQLWSIPIPSKEN